MGGVVPDAGGPPARVSVRGVSKNFGATAALKSVSLDIADGSAHALVGRNGAGKSTLVSVLTGLVRPDAGQILYGGRPAPDPVARQEWRTLVACVYQKSTILPDLTVAENLFLGAQPVGPSGMVRWREMYATAARVLEEWQIDVDPRSPAHRLSVGQRQLVEVARALRVGTRLIVLDEPTAQLEAREISRLYENVQQLAAAGVTFLYISHHLQEIYDICDRLTVLRDGCVVADAQVADMDSEALVTAMVGQVAGHGPSRTSAAAGPLRAVSNSGSQAGSEIRVLDVDDLELPGAFSDVSFSVCAGERVGIGGLAGSGKAQLGETLAGLRIPSRGTVTVAGRTQPRGRPDRAVADGLGFVPQDRHRAGFSPNLSVEENITTSITGRLGRWGWISPSRRRQAAERQAAALQIVVRDVRQLTSDLSGGNQQKTVMGRALASDPALLVLISPTAGVDIASKRALFDTIHRSEAGVVLISDELDELALCERVLVLFAGRIVAEFGAERTDRDLVAAMEGA